mgnify:CR=1 FL=1
MRNFTAQSALSALAMTVSMAFAGTAVAQDEVTFHKDIEPILQRSCQNCHRVGGAGPMPLVTYEEVAPFAGLIEYKTGLRDRAGAMPPRGHGRDHPRDVAGVARRSPVRTPSRPKGRTRARPRPRGG